LELFVSGLKYSPYVEIRGTFYFHGEFLKNSCMHLDLDAGFNYLFHVIFYL